MQQTWLELYWLSQKISSRQSLHKSQSMHVTSIIVKKATIQNSESLIAFLL